MKKLILSIPFLLLTFLLSCQENNAVLTQGQIQFSLSEEERVDNTGRTLGASTPTSALVVIEDLNGNVLIPQKKLPLYNFGGGYVSENIQINTGEYKLTQFLILDEYDSILYATPKEGSKLDQFVGDPLPILFSVTENESTLVIPQVLAVNPTDTPESFGYVSFGFEVLEAKTKLKEVVFNYETPFSYKYYYAGDNLIKTEIHYTNEQEPAIYYLYSYNDFNQLIESNHYQAGELIEKKKFQYNDKNQLVYVDGYNNEELTYSQDGILLQIKSTPGNFGHHEVANYSYDENNNVSKIIIQGYNEFNDETWQVTERYFYDHQEPLSGVMAASYYQGAISYLLPELHYFSQIRLNNNPVRLEYSEYFDWYDVPSVKIFYSEFEYNKFGLPIKEKIHNPDLNAYYSNDGLVKEFIYE